SRIRPKTGACTRPPTSSAWRAASRRASPPSCALEPCPFRTRPGTVPGRGRNGHVREQRKRDDPSTEETDEEEGGVHAGEGGLPRILSAAARPLSCTAFRRASGPASPAASTAV